MSQVPKGYDGFDAHGILSRLERRVCGAYEIEHTTIASTMLALPGILIAWMAAMDGYYIVTAAYCYIFIGSAVSIPAILNRHKAGWFLLVSVLSLSCIVSLLLIVIGWLFCFPVFLFYLVALTCVARRAVLTEFSVSSVSAAVVIVLPPLVAAAIIAAGVHL